MVKIACPYIGNTGSSGYKISYASLQLPGAKANACAKREEEEIDVECIYSRSVDHRGSCRNDRSRDAEYIRLCAWPFFISL